jgi:hypothetical protein
LAVFLVGFCFLYYGAGLEIYKPGDDEEKIILKTLEEKDNVQKQRQQKMEKQ